MNFPVILIRTEEGYAVGCPSIPGCWTQGATREQAMENIQDAITEVLAATRDLEAEQWLTDGCEVEKAEVEVFVHA